MSRKNLVLGALAALGVALAWVAMGTTGSSMPWSASMRSVEVSGRSYMWPVDQQSSFSPFKVAASGTISRNFWNAVILEAAGLSHRPHRGPSMHVSISPVSASEMPLWDAVRANHEPPVVGPSTLVTSEGDKFVWRDRNPEYRNHPIYITFKGRREFYVHCFEHQFGNAAESCRLHWNDRGLSHSFGVPGDMPEAAVRILPVYRKVIAAE